MQKLLVIRNDKLGDFMLAWPAFALLKQSAPTLKLTALVPEYTAPLAEICPYLDEVIIDAKDKKDKVAFQQVLNEIKGRNFDGVISFVSDVYNAKLTWKSAIPYRLAPATKLIQFLYNHRLTQRRSQSAKAEFEYNLDLARAFLADQHLSAVEPAPPYLTFAPSAVEKQKVFLAESLALSMQKKWLFVHSGSGGSANNLSLRQYADLIEGITDVFDCEVILTAGPNESEKVHQLAGLLQGKQARVYDKNQGLVDFAHSLACADLFMSGSTGPLHLSGALNIPTVGFYPSRLSALPRRWRPINEKGRHIAFMPPEGKATEKNLTLIKIDEAMLQIIPFIRRHWDSSC
ncbi:ADP-heptose:LPS heptosyltransferase [Mesocricetibacter intestinalis]|uniref:ADP-heptose:LPS heptosyltransferase n=1 Tax=Mesocricetibacter intestinalis TaxID=1521930 RepID=A0A4R6VCV3_9PAST|nr:glycosyltransferase family 9 protein [Mesocricetibacter intestinalis]TDQ58075.1 ADP-heptose:LPS heptosyltransferase [Mesocricetibacter intestinalis]